MIASRGRQRCLLALLTSLVPTVVWADEPPKAGVAARSANVTDEPPKAGVAARSANVTDEPPKAGVAAPSAAAVHQTPPPGPPQVKLDSASTLQPPKYHRPIRSGVVLALSLDGGVASASGYPNDSKLLNDKAYYGRTGPLGGGGFTLSFSGALAEYLNVGFYVSSTGYSNEAWKVSSGGGGIRMDAFPFTFASNKWLRSWAIYGIAGLGAVNVKYEKPGSNVADLDGTQSNLGLGSFYEFRFGALGIGPDSRFDAVVSRTASRVAYNVGFRLAFYPSRLF